MSRKVEINKEHLLLLISEKKTKKEIAKDLKIGTNTLYNYLRLYGIAVDGKYNKNVFHKLPVITIDVEENPITPEQEADNEWKFSLKAEVEVAKITFEPVMEDFFGEKGNRFYKRELPQTTITFEQFINRKHDTNNKRF